MEKSETNPNCQNFNDQNKAPKTAYASRDIESLYNGTDMCVLVEKSVSRRGHREYRENISCYEIRGKGIGKKILDFWDFGVRPPRG